jgi:isopentenyl diphosphate isomerase/L-lactate dehydrogenase-like FMN-dependent dehydrogenase
VGGEDGMSHVLNIFRNELDIAMGLRGLSDIKKADPSLVALPNDGNQRNTTID